jgi:predicted MFS family arabinose efflux permease
VGKTNDERLPFLGDLRGRAALVVLGCLICQLALGFGYVFPPLASLIIEDFGWTRTEYFGVRIPQLVVMAGASPLLGLIIVRAGARRALIFSAILIAATFALISQMQSLWHLYTLLMFAAVGLVGLGDISVGQLVTQWVERRRGLALGVVYAGSNLSGWILVPIWVGIAKESDWRTAFLAIGACALFVILPAVLLLIRDRATDLSISDIVQAASHAPGGGNDLRLRDAVRTRTFWILGAGLFSFFFYFVGVLDHLVLFLTDSGITSEDATYYFSTALGLGLVSKITLGIIADYIPEKASILFDHALLATSSVLLLFLPNDDLLWPFVVSYGFATAARDVVYPLIISRCFGERYMAEIYGALMLALPGGAIGAIYAARVHDLAGSYQVPFATFAVVNVAMLVALSFIREERPLGRLTDHE